MIIRYMLTFFKRQTKKKIPLATPNKKAHQSTEDIYKGCQNFTDNSKREHPHPHQPKINATSKYYIITWLLLYII